jgi:hypothetical protein
MSRPRFTRKKPVGPIFIDSQKLHHDATACRVAEDIHGTHEDHEEDADDGI